MKFFWKIKERHKNSKIFIAIFDHDNMISDKFQAIFTFFEKFLREVDNYLGLFYKDDFNNLLH